MPRGNERSLIYVREQDARGRLVVRAVVTEPPPTKAGAASQPRNPGQSNMARMAQRKNRIQPASSKMNGS